MPHYSFLTEYYFIPKHLRVSTRASCIVITVSSPHAGVTRTKKNAYGAVARNYYCIQRSTIVELYSIRGFLPPGWFYFCFCNTDVGCDMFIFIPMGCRRKCV